MDEAIDARLTEVFIGLMRARRLLDQATFDDLLGAVTVEIDIGIELALENAYRRRSEGTIVPFPLPVERHLRSIE